MVHHVNNIDLRLVFNLLQDVNETFPKEEILSRRVFRYDSKNKKLKVVAIG